MASYPDSVVAFSVKSDGQTINASHIDTLQDEVTAIEAGLLNGTAPLNSSNSTLANLSVTGASTIAGALTVGGALNVTGSFTVSGVQTANSQPRARVFHGSTQTLSNNLETAFTFDSEDFDPQTLHSTAASPTRLTLGSTGVWLIGANIHFDAYTAASAYIRFQKNGVTAVGTKGGVNVTASGTRVMMSHSVVEVCSSATDYVEVLGFQNSGFSLGTGNASSRVDQNQFYAVKLW